MEKKLALLVVYNHRYDKNIPVIDKIYQNRFSHVFHLVPFYDGEQENVIPVYDSSHRFQNYIAQAYPHLRNKGFTHYLVVADDMLLNPRINENSLWEQTGLDIHDCYISRISIIQTRKHFWTHSVKALKYKVKQPAFKDYKTQLCNILNAYANNTDYTQYSSNATTRATLREYVFSIVNEYAYFDRTINDYTGKIMDTVGDESEIKEVYDEAIERIDTFLASFVDDEPSEDESSAEESSEDESSEESFEESSEESVDEPTEASFEVTPDDGSSESTGR